jgi:hypothetical protein
VQIAESVGGRRRIVRHVGSARDEAELGLLLEEANRLLADDQQGVLDLGITPVAPKAVMIGPATPVGLFASTAAPPPSRQMVSRPRVLKTSSRLLYDALAGIYSSLGFDVVCDEVFRDLVIARVVEPTSLLDVDRILAEMGRVSASLSTRKRTLHRAHTGTYRDQIATACFNHALTTGDVSLCLYDVTTLYFEAEHEDELRKVGYSKERRVDPQIVVGLLVAPSHATARRPSRSSTSSPPPTTKPHHRRPSPPGSKATGASRTGSTGSATSPTTKTAPKYAPATRPTSWPPCATPPSASHDWPASRTSPKAYDITPETPKPSSNSS